eukprot:g3908.t1
MMTPAMTAAASSSAPQAPASAPAADFVCYDNEAVRLQKQHQAGLSYLHEFHRVYVGARHFEVVELVSTTQADQLIAAALKLFENAYMALMQVVCPLRLTSLFVDTRISFHTKIFETQIRYLLEMEHGVETAARRLHDLTSSLDPLAQSVARAMANSGYADQLQKVLSVHRELAINVLHFLEPILGDIAEHYSVPNHLPKELIPRHEHKAFRSFFPAFSSVFRVAPTRYLPIGSITASAGTTPGSFGGGQEAANSGMEPSPLLHDVSIDPARLRNVMSLDLGGALGGLYLSNADADFVTLDNKDTSKNHLNAVFSWDFLAALDNPKRELLSTGNQFERICLYVKTTGGRSHGAFHEYDIEDYHAAISGDTEVPTTRGTEKFERHWREMEMALLPGAAGIGGGNGDGNLAAENRSKYLSEFQKLTKQTRSQKSAANTDVAGVPRTERSPLQLLRMVDRQVSLSYFVISYSLDSPAFPPGACRGVLLDFDAADCLPSEAGWAHYHFQSSTADPYNVSVSYRGRPLGPGARLMKNNIHTTNTMSRLAQWSSMVSLYKSVNHYSPDLLFVHPAVGNCLLLKKLLESGPVKPKIVFVAINPAIPPPIEVAPDMRQYWELIDHGHRSRFESDRESAVWKLQCSLQFAEVNIMQKHGYVLDHVEHFFAVYVWKKAFRHDPWMDSKSGGGGSREVEKRGSTSPAGQKKLEAFAVNPPVLVEEEAHPADRCLIGLRPSVLYQKWLKGWHCSPAARVVGQLEYEIGFDLSPLTACQAEKKGDREAALCLLHKYYVDAKIPIFAHNLPDRCRETSANGASASSKSSEEKNREKTSQLPATMQVGLPTAPTQQSYEVKRRPERFIDEVPSSLQQHDRSAKAAASTSSSMSPVAVLFEDAQISSDVEDKNMSILQSFAARVLHEQPLLKWFIEKDKRGRCFDGECECFPPYRGTMCDMEDVPQVPTNTTRLNAVLHFVMPESERDLADIERALPSIWQNLNRHYDYPVVIFHEGMSEASRRRIVLCSKNRIWFANLGRDFASLNAVPELWRDQIDVHQMPFALGYRHMCRWRSGPVFLEPVLQNFDYGMTLDTDSFFPGPWKEDPFMMLKQTNKVAAFPHLGREAASVAVNFLYYYLLYCKMHNLNPRRTKILASLVEKNWKWYQQTFMSDIEILYLPWFRDPEGEYQKFFRYMDATGGFYLYRWGNNPFRTFAMGTFLDDEQVSLATVPYLHQEFCTCGGADGECISIGNGTNYEKTCPEQKEGDGESLDAKLLHLQPWRGLDWQVNKFEKEDFARFVRESSEEGAKGEL